MGNTFLAFLVYLPPGLSPRQRRICKRTEPWSILVLHPDLGGGCLLGNLIIPRVLYPENRRICPPVT